MSHEKDALIATLYSELTTIKNIIDSNLSKLACVGKLGFVHTQTISKVLRAYLAWQEVPRRLILEFGECAKIRNDYILVTNQQKERYKAVLQAARAPVVQAAEALDRESASCERGGSL
jgi:hypothetical protein